MLTAKKLISAVSILGTIVLTMANTAVAATPSQYRISNPGSVQCTTTRPQVYICTDHNPFITAQYTATPDGNDLVINNLNGLTQSIVVPFNTQDVFCARVDGSILPSCGLGFSDVKYTINASTDQSNNVIFNQLSVESHYIGMIPAVLNGDIKTTVSGMTLAKQS